MALPRALASLCKIPHWVIWRAELRNGKQTKPPRMSLAPQRYASTTDETTWSTYQEAEDAARAEGLNSNAGGVGFVLLGSGISGIDLDHCVDLDTGEIAAWAMPIIEHAERCGCYIEFSPNLTGMHILGKSQGAEVHRRWGVGEGDGRIEVFRDTKRFLTVTGKQFGQGSVDGDIDPVIDALLKGEKKKVNGKAGAARTSTGGADHSPSGIFHLKVCRMAEQGLDVGEICEMMRKYPKRYDETSIARYEAANRLLQEIQRSFSAWEGKQGARLEVRWSNGRLPQAKSCADCRIAIEALGVRVAYDEFHYVFMIEGEILGKLAGRLNDAALDLIGRRIAEKYNFEPSEQTVFRAVRQIGIENAFDPVLEYLDGLKWDGRPRVDKWVVRYLSCADNVLNCTIGRLVLIASVRRVRQPGVKFDQITVLEGEGGTDKSTSIKTLAGAENFSDQSILNVSDQKQQEQIQGVWHYEIADLKGMEHAHTDAIKAFASRTEDRGRRAYGRVIERQLRRCIFWGTTDQTGGGYMKGDNNRRWWPLRTGHIKINNLRRDRDQIWAEAATLEAVGESIELPRELWDAVKEEQEARREHDPWELRLAKVVGGHYPRRDALPGWEERVASADLFSAVLGLRASDEKGGGTWKRVAEIMRRLGWEPAQARLGGKSVGCWVRQHDS